MPKDYPDFGMLETKVAYPVMGDLGELAARLGSIDLYDRRGLVVDFDNFESPLLRWRTLTASAESYVRLNSDNAKSGSQSVKLHSYDDLLEFAQLYNYLPVLGSYRIGGEISFSDLSTTPNLYFLMQGLDDTTGWYAGIKINAGEEKLYLLDSTNTYIELIDIGELMADPFVFYTVKLVVDISTAKYARLLLAADEYDLSSYDLYTTVTAGTPQIGHFLKLESVGGVGGDVWLDDFIFTQDEP